MGSFPYPRDGAVTIDYEFVLLFKKQGLSPKPTIEQKELSKLTTEEWRECFSGHWNFSGVRQTEHPAMYPEKLPSRLIKMFSFMGETVLDPFLGSGTTSLAAKKLSRNSIGYEINPEFISVINNKLSEPSINFSDCGLHEVINCIADPLDEVFYDSLPYLYADPNTLTKKEGEVRPPAAKDFHTIQKVIDSVTFKLSNQMVVRLIGVVVPEELEQQAVKFIMSEVWGKPLTIRFDPIKWCSKDVRYCYLCLKNKTLINTHMIRNGVAIVDSSVDFKLIAEFQKVAKEVSQSNENLWMV
jgi:site-specific DNA-methyltransferase (adenine-specific)